MSQVISNVYELRESALYEDYVLPCWHPICMWIFIYNYGKKVVINKKE